MRGLGGLTRAELRRWLPWRAVGFTLLGLGLLGLLYANWLVQPAKILSELVVLFLWLWIGVLMLATVAMTQSVVAGEISQGTAAWVVAKPVARPAFILSKFVAMVPVVVVAMVGIPGLAARRLLGVAESNGRTDFDGQDLIRLIEDPSSRSTFKPLMDLDIYLGMLALMVVLLLVIAAAMILFGCVLRHATAIFAIGLMVPIALIVLANVNIDHQILSLTPAWAMESMKDGIAGNSAAVLGPSVVAALWTVGMLGAATWWFSRREL
jgi:ABC-type transport system involved in multi-copper enzyme maturation permease subunit